MLRFMRKHFVGVDAVTVERFWTKVRKGEGCWEWLAAKNRTGYGAFGGTRPAVELAHRYSYRITYGAFDDELCVCHRCDNPACVRPDHLFLGTKGDNNRDMFAKKRGVFCHRKAEEHQRAKLTNDDVQFIRRRIHEGETISALAAKYGVTITAIWNMWNGRSWTSVPWPDGVVWRKLTAGRRPRARSEEPRASEAPRPHPR